MTWKQASAEELDYRGATAPKKIYLKNRMGTSKGAPNKENALKGGAKFFFGIPLETLTSDVLPDRAVLSTHFTAVLTD